MNIRKFWYFACLVFGFHSLNSLIEESHEVVYEKSTAKAPVEYLTCKPLNFNHWSNQTEIDLEKLQADLLKHFNSSDRPASLRRQYPSVFESILNRTKSEGFVILNEMFCLVSNDQTKLVYVDWFLLHETVHFAMNKESFDLLQMTRWTDKFDELIVLNKKHPYSDCSEDNSRFRCLNKCFKRNFRLSRYFYEGNETGVIYLNSPPNRSVEDSERNCFRECKQENCKIARGVNKQNTRFFSSVKFSIVTQLIRNGFPWIWSQIVPRSTGISLTPCDPNKCPRSDLSELE